MTSVVGILIIILVVPQLGAKQAVQRIQSDPNLFLDQRSERKLSQAELELETLKKERIRLSAESEELTAKIGGRPTLVLKQKNTQQIQSMQPKPSNPQLAKEMATLKKKNSQLVTSSKTLEENLNQLEKKLSKLPKKSGKPIVRSLRLPDPKEPRPGSKGYRFICQGGSISP